MPTYYPVYLDLRGRRCVVVGGNLEAERKARGLLEASARVVLISPQATAHLQALAQQGLLQWEQRHYTEGDLEGAFLTIVADTSSMGVNRRAAREAETRGSLINVVDMPDLCNFIAPAVARRGSVTAAVSTNGLSPALARKLRQDLERGQDLRWAELAEVVAEARDEMRRRRARPSPEHWQRCLSEEVYALFHQQGPEAARQRLVELLLNGGRVAEEVS
ncbi:MAG: bifunctional precorrin-2 dehydrogenase/sirohydrochlorin ferrochelatase [Chloroflexi bacterium]|nr:bifunctional precorrin-2 dehydrogenase/sirohydrochlorin ferrochelatase [Chloroflexota bacterium]